MRIQQPGDNSTTEITIAFLSNLSSNSIEMDLDPNQTTEIGGDLFVELDTVQNPKADEFEGTIILSGNQGGTHDSSITFTIVN